MADPDFGSDLAGVDDIDPALSTVTGRRALAEAVARRHGTPEGSQPGDPAYGYDLTRLIGSSESPSVIQSKSRAQCLMEQGVTAARVTVLRVAETIELSIALETQTGPLRLVLSADQVTVAILGIE